MSVHHQHHQCYSFDLEDILNEEIDEINPNFYGDFDLESLLNEEDNDTITYDVLNQNFTTELNGIKISEDITAILERFSKSFIDSSSHDDGDNNADDDKKKEIDLLLASDDSDENEDDALTSFRHYEDKELKSVRRGCRSVISALNISTSQQNESSNSDNNVYSGNVRCTELDVITSQLKRNATFKTHGPGTATALSVHDRFIAVGTARGLVLLFDQNQEIRQVVGALINSPTARCFDSVTAIDINVPGTLLLCGYETGEITLWDLARGAILKRLLDLHSEAITRLRFIPGVGELTINQGDPSNGDQQLSAVSADRTGICFRFQLAKTVLFNTYNVEQDCLLNGSAGQVLDISPLKPYTPPSIILQRDAQTRVANAPGTGGSLTSRSLLSALAINQLSNIGLTVSDGEDSPHASRDPTSTQVQLSHNWAFLAISTTNRTYVLQVIPTVKISYKWSAPITLEDTKIPTIAEDGSESVVAQAKPKIISCLDWTWSRRRYEVLHPNTENQVTSRQRSATTDSVESQSSASLSVATRQSGGPASDPEQIIKFLDSSYEKNGPLFPLLARSWGSNIQILAVVQFSAPVVPPPVQPASNSPFKYLRISPDKRPKAAVVKESSQQLVFHSVASQTFAVDGFLTMRWLSEKIIVATTAIDIRFLNQNLEPVETIQLNSPLAMFHQEMLLNMSPLIDYGRSKCLPNCVTSLGGRFFLMTTDALFSFQMQSWTEKVDALVCRNQWLEGLSIALQYGVAQEGVQMERVLPKKTAKTYRLALDNYLRQYIDLAIYQSFSMRKVIPVITSRAAHDLNQDNFQLVVAVCVEYCVVAKRLNLLFTDVFSVFASVEQEGLFLDALEPQILSGTLSTLPDTILEALLEHTVRTSNYVAFERCLTYLKFDNYSNDEPVIQAIQTMLLERNLITGYLSLKAIGLREFESAFCGACIAVHTITDEAERSTMVYKVLLFLQYCSENRSFPHGESEIISSTQVFNLATLLMSEALEFDIMAKLFDSFDLKKHALCREKLESSVQDLTNVKFPYLSILCKSDVAATVYCASLLIKSLVRLYSPLDSVVTQLLCALHSFVSTFSPSASSQASPKDNFKLKRSTSMSPTTYVFQYCLDEIVDNSQSLSHELIQDFIYHCELSLVHISRLELELKVGKMVSLQSVHASLQQFLQELLMAHGLWVALLSMHNRRQFMHTPMMLETSLRSYLMHLSKRSKSQRLKNINSPVRSDSVVAPVDALILFSYIVLEFEAQQADGISAEEVIVLKQSVCKYLADLYVLDAERTKSIISKYLLESCADVLQHTELHPGTQFEILNYMIKTVQAKDANAISSHFTMENITTYVKLLVSYRPMDVYAFLNGCAHYSHEECLSLCRPVKEAYDATALLMERGGDVTGALQLLFTSLSANLASGKEAIEGMLNGESVTSSRKKVGYTQSDVLKKLDCYRELQRVNNAIANLCSRNSDKTNSVLWFQAFDRFLAERRKSNSSSNCCIIIF